MNAIKIVAIIALISIIGGLFRCSYTKGYDSGYSTYDAMYKEKLAKELEEENKKIRDKYQAIIDQIKQDKKIEVVYKDRVKIVKEIVKEENMQCKMTTDQVAKLNEFIKY